MNTLKLFSLILIMIRINSPNETQKEMQCDYFNIRDWKSELKTKMECFYEILLANESQINIIKVLLTDLILVNQLFKQTFHTRDPIKEERSIIFFDQLVKIIQNKLPHLKISETKLSKFSIKSLSIALNKFSITADNYHTDIMTMSTKNLQKILKQLTSQEIKIQEISKKSKFPKTMQSNTQTRMSLLIDISGDIEESQQNQNQQKKNLWLEALDTENNRKKIGNNANLIHKCYEQKRATQAAQTFQEIAPQNESESAKLLKEAKELYLLKIQNYVFPPSYHQEKEESKGSVIALEYSTMTLEEFINK